VARDRDSIRTLDEIFILALGRALDFLIEVTQGPCAENQLCISGSAVVEVCGYIACTSQFECLTKPEMGYGIKVKAFTLLSACLEGRSDLIVEKRLAAKFELSFYNSTVIQLHSIIKELETGISTVTTQSDTSKDKDRTKNYVDQSEIKVFDVESLVQCAACLFYLRDKISQLVEFRSICAPPKESDRSQVELYVAYKELKKRLGYIEVNWMNRIEILYYPMPTEAESLPLTTMLEFEGTVNLESQDARVKGIMDASVGFMDEMKVLDGLKSYWMYRVIKANLVSIQYSNFFSFCFAEHPVTAGSH